MADNAKTGKEEDGRKPSLLVIAALLLSMGATGAGSYMASAALGPSLLAEGKSSEPAVVKTDAGQFLIKFNGQEGEGQLFLSVTADIIHAGEEPTSPGHLRDALYKLLISAVEIPLVRTSTAPQSALPAAIQTIAEAHAPWLRGVTFERYHFIPRRPKG